MLRAFPLRAEPGLSHHLNDGPASSLAPRIACSPELAQGATLHEVKEILWHSQIALTANLYGHAYTSVLRESVDRVGSLLAPENPVAPSVAPSTAPKRLN